MGDLIIQRYNRSDWRVGLLKCLHSLKSARQVRGQGRRGSATQKQSIGQKGCGLGGVSRCCKGGSTDREQRDADARQRIVTPWNRRGETSMKSSIPCSHRGRALVVKGTEDVENAEANSKYQDKARGQRPRNFIRPVSMGFSLR
ncbi:hypothetical protein GW17_00036199 [Ensete ventricosum]|nr:hypothetical protein GW17_00036199 [Ensete ventricosum]